MTLIDSRPAQLLASLLLAMPSLGFTQVPASATTGLQVRLHAEVERAFQADRPGAAVIVVKDGIVVLRQAAGLASLELGVPLEPGMIFRVGSVTKQFTAVAVLMLLEQGKLSLSDEITKFLPDYPTQGQKITVEGLLTHTAGIKSYTDMPEFWRQQRQDRSVAELTDFFKTEPMDFEPGERWYYSNSGYVLLGAVIEKASGQTYADYIEKNIFEPLGMTHSSFDRTSKVVQGRVPGYRANGDGYVNAEYISMSLPYAAGSLLSSVDDLARWDAALYTENLARYGRLELSAISGTEFFVNADPIARITFERTGDGSIASMLIHDGIAMDRRATRTSRPSVGRKSEP